MNLEIQESYENLSEPYSGIVELSSGNRNVAFGTNIVGEQFPLENFANQKTKDNSFWWKRVPVQ